MSARRGPEVDLVRRARDAGIGVRVGFGRRAWFAVGQFIPTHHPNGVEVALVFQHRTLGFVFSDPRAWVGIVSDKMRAKLQDDLVPGTEAECVERAIEFMQRLGKIQSSNRE